MKYEIFTKCKMSLPEDIELSIWAYLYGFELKNLVITAFRIFWFKIEPDSNSDTFFLSSFFSNSLYFASSFRLAISLSFWFSIVDSVNLYSTFFFSARSDLLTFTSCSTFWCVVLTWCPSSIVLVLSFIRSFLQVLTIASLFFTMTFSSSYSFWSFSNSGNIYMLPKHVAKASYKDYG